MAEKLWEPDSEFKERTTLFEYLHWLEKERKLDFKDYHELWKWSVTSLEDFWRSIWEFFDIKGKSAQRILEKREMPYTRWFLGAELNFAENVLCGRNSSDDKIALFSFSESQPPRSFTWGELRRKALSFAAALNQAGVKAGDVVAAYSTNTPDTLFALLGAALIGAMWTSVPLEFGAHAAIQRLSQLNPKIIFTQLSYSYNGKLFDKSQDVERVKERTNPQMVVVMDDQEFGKGFTSIKEFLKVGSNFTPVTLNFEHPLWVLFTSGTTGLPKAIVHSHGGITLESHKVSSLHMNISENSRVLFYTSTGWVAWNRLISTLITGASIVLVDGSALYPIHRLWDIAEKVGVTYFGMSTPYVLTMIKNKFEPCNLYSLDKLEAIGVTAAPLSPQGFEWLFKKVKQVWIESMSGGTEVFTDFVGGVPIQPVFAGEIQGRCLGASVYAYNEQGKPVVGEVGELVVTEPMPSMPIFFWGDVQFQKYKQSYFSKFPNVWTHGDLIEITQRGTCIIYGRSDATIKRKGVRIGVSEIYDIVESIEGVKESLAVGLEKEGDSIFVLFVVLNEGFVLEHLEEKIKKEIVTKISPRFVPDLVLQVSEIPKTLNGKKLEVPVKRILMGENAEKVVNKEALLNPESLEQFVKLSKLFT